eukprot:3336909-Rhodomonas_salina.5
MDKSPLRLRQTSAEAGDCAAPSPLLLPHPTCRTLGGPRAAVPEWDSKKYTLYHQQPLDPSETSLGRALPTILWLVLVRPWALEQTDSEERLQERRRTWRPRCQLLTPQNKSVGAIPRGGSKSGGCSWRCEKRIGWGPTEPAGIRGRKKRIH